MRLISNVLPLARYVQADLLLDPSAATVYKIGSADQVFGWLAGLSRLSHSAIGWLPVSTIPACDKTDRTGR